MKIFYLLLTVMSLLLSKQSYPDNHSCKECHENIYEEYQSSMHAKGYFSDELHRKIADRVSQKKYECAVCHMPAANNLKALIEGEARPDKSNATHTDAISCYFCHTIAYVKEKHRFNENIKAKQAANYKPTLYGRLDHPDENDQHSSVKNPVYAKKVCMGCHSHKLNENSVTIFRAMQKGEDSTECINCHMPEVSGGAEKMDKRARGQHASHRFLGIRDQVFRQKGVDINLTVQKDLLQVRLTNKMGHPLIIQPARAKYLKIILYREGKVLWQNYRKTPQEDTQGYFAYNFKAGGKPVIIPAHATVGKAHNLAAKESKILTYSIPKLQKGDEIEVSLYVQLAKSDCAKVVTLDDKAFSKPMLIKKVRQKF